MVSAASYRESNELVMPHLGQREGASAAVQRVLVSNFPGLPEPVGTYSHVAIDSVTGLIAIAGQVGIDPDTEQLAASPEQQCVLALRNAIAAVVAAGGTPGSILRLTAYLADKNLIGAYRHARNTEYERLGLRPPPHLLVVVSALGHDEYVIEVDALAVRAMSA